MWRSWCVLKDKKNESSLTLPLASHPTVVTSLIGKSWIHACLALVLKPLRRTAIPRLVPDDAL